MITSKHKRAGLSSENENCLFCHAVTDSNLSHCYRLTVDIIKDLIEGKLKINIWAQAVAQDGVYWYFTSILLNQILASLTLHLGDHVANASAPTSKLTATEARIRQGREVQSRTRSPRRATAAMLGGRESDGVRTSVNPLVKLLLILLWGLLSGVFIYSFYLRALWTAFKLDDDITIDKYDTDIKIDVLETYHWSVAGGFRHLLYQNHKWGAKNEPMFHLAVCFVLVLPLARFTILVWLVVGDRWLNDTAFWYIRHTAGFFSLFTGADIFSVAAGLMVWQAPYLFTNLTDEMSMKANVVTGYWVFASIAFVESASSLVLYLLSGRMEDERLNPLLPSPASSAGLDVVFSPLLDQGRPRMEEEQP